MSKYSVSFRYPFDVREPDPGSPEEYVHEEFNSLINEALTRGGFDWTPEYFWPDGSCFKTVRSALTASELQLALDQALIPTRCSVLLVRIEDSGPDGLTDTQIDSLARSYLEMTERNLSTLMALAATDTPKFKIDRQLIICTEMLLLCSDLQLVQRTGVHPWRASEFLKEDDIPGALQAHVYARYNDGSQAGSE